MTVGLVTLRYMPLSWCLLVYRRALLVVARFRIDSVIFEPIMHSSATKIRSST